MTKGLPLEDVCLVLRYAVAEEPIPKSITITVKNKYVLRVLTTWLRLGIDLAIQGEKSYYYDDLPAFASKEIHVTRVNVAQEKGSELRDCKATDLHKVPYTLTLTQGSKELNNINLASVEFEYIA